MVIEYDGRAFNFHTGQGFPLSLCGSVYSTRANARKDTGKDGAPTDYSSRSLIWP